MYIDRKLWPKINHETFSNFIANPILCLYHKRVNKRLIPSCATEVHTKSSKVQVPLNEKNINREHRNYYIPSGSET